MEQVQTEASKSGQMQEREPASAGQRQFLRTIPLLGEEGVARLRASHVAVFGLGGVGSFAAEAAGAGRCGHTDAGGRRRGGGHQSQPPVGGAAQHAGDAQGGGHGAQVADICPDTRVLPRTEFFDGGSAASFDFSRFDYVVDAIDSVESKVLLVLHAQAQGRARRQLHGDGQQARRLRPHGGRHL